MGYRSRPTLGQIIIKDVKLVDFNILSNRLFFKYKSSGILPFSTKNIWIISETRASDNIDYETYKLI